MAKNIRRLLSVCMVLCVLIGVLPLQALAAEDGTTTEIVDGVEITTTQTTEVTTDGENTTVTVTIEQTSEGTKESTGEKIEGTETTVTSTTTDAEGNELGNSWSVDGYEKKEWTEEITTDDTGLPEVNVALKPGETTTADATSDPAVETEEDGTTTTTVTDREVTAETGKIEITANQGEVTLDPVAPELWEKEDGVFVNGYDKDGNRKTGIYEFENDIAGVGTLKWNSEEQKWDAVGWSDNGEFRLGGWGEQTTTEVIHYDNLTYAKDDDGNIIFDENGNPVIESLGWADYTLPVQFALHDKDGNIVYAYCVDLETGTSNGSYYNVSNLEDSDYYASEESEAHIRAIVSHGYWGSGNDADENGDYATGSLAKIKDDLKKAFEDGTLEDKEVTVGSGDDATTIMLSELMQGLTEGEALAVTQAAIWTFANGSKDGANGAAGSIVKGADGFWGGNKTRLATFYNYMISLTEEAQSESIVIDDTSFLAEDSLSLVVGDKVGEVEETDADGNTVSNGVYDTALNFTLAFVPGENDDLLVLVKYIDMDGKEVTITKRLAGENAQGQDIDTLVPAEDGSYTIKGLKLSENKEFNFDLKLQGTQYLEQGVYVYSPVGGRDASQTMVGLAEGNRSVDVNMNLTVSFSVDENNHVVAERVWHDESDPVMEPTTPDEDEEEETPPPVNYRVVINDDGLEEIPDEPVPLASAPKTGDNSGMWLILVLVTAFGLVAINVVSKKRQHNTF